MQTITIKSLAEGLGLSLPTVANLLKGAPYYLPPGRGAARRYTLAGVIPRIAAKHRAKISAVVARAMDDGSLFVGANETMADDLESWLDSPMKERLRAVRTKFFNALQTTTLSNAFYADSERIRTLLILSPSVLPYVLTGDKKGLPSWPDFARAFVLVHLPQDVAA